jgi:hypothetical protein
MNPDHLRIVLITITSGVAALACEHGVKIVHYFLRMHPHLLRGLP